MRTISILAISTFLFASTFSVAHAGVTDAATTRAEINRMGDAGFVKLPPTRTGDAGGIKLPPRRTGDAGGIKVPLLTDLHVPMLEPVDVSSLRAGEAGGIKMPRLA